MDQSDFILFAIYRLNFSKIYNKDLYEIRSINAFKFQSINQPIFYFGSGLMMSKQDNQNGYIPSKYSRAFNNYSRTEIKSVIPILRSVARSCNIEVHFPVYKLLKAVAKIFLMNEIQGIFFAYMIRQTNWDIRDKIITANSEKVRDVVCCNSEHPDYRNFILYLLLITYNLKSFLNEDSEQLMEQAIRICPNFRLIFQNWTKKHSDLTKRINPKTLNKVHQDLCLKIRHQQLDFNLLVDSIMQISPAYNPERAEKDKKIYKKEDKKELLPRQVSVKMIKVEQEHINQRNAMFSSSRLYEMPCAGLNISEGSNFQVFGQKSGTLGTRFGRSVFGSSAVVGMVNYEVKEGKDDDYCQQLNLGLQEGESQQNVNLRQDIPQAPSISIINISRTFSNSDKFFTFKTGNEYR